MTGGWVAGVPGLTPARRVGGARAGDGGDRAAVRDRGLLRGPGRLEGAAAPGVVPRLHDGLTPLAISPRQRLDDAVKAVSDLPFGGTDCALPMLYAQAKEKEIDTFVIYTDSETWAGDVHPVQALARLPPGVGHRARLVVVGMVSNGFSIADPNDPGMLDVVGFDTATPQLISDFARGEVLTRAKEDAPRPSWPGLGRPQQRADVAQPGRRTGLRNRLMRVRIPPSA